MFNITICNENQDEVKVLIEHLKQYSIDYNVQYNLSTYTNFDKLLENTSEPIDILLMDIKLENKQVVKQTNKRINEHFKNIQVIYTCDVLRFMINGFDLKNFRYVLKPIKYQALEDELNESIKGLKVRETYTTKDIYTSFDIFNRLEGSAIKDIHFIESTGKECLAVIGDSEIKLPYHIDDLEKNVNSDLFFRCNDDYIINLKKISKIGKYFVISNGYEILVPKNKFKALKENLKIMLKLK